MCSGEHGHVILFEVFEASPSSEKVLESKGALVWDFPGSIIAVPTHKIHDRDFASALATFLEQASAESLGGFAAMVIKAGVASVENRDTPNPTIITSFMTAILEVVGHRLPLPLLRKHIRDDVNFNESHLPWRRMPLWLVFRVSLARHFFHLHGSDEARLLYKFTIVFFLAHLVPHLQEHVALEDLPHLRAKLGRRVAKLEVEMNNLPQASSKTTKKLFDSVQSTFASCLSGISQILEDQWKSIRDSSPVKFPDIPRCARAGDLELRLYNSWPALQSAVERYKSSSREAPRQAEARNSPAKSPISTKAFEVFSLEQELMKLAASPAPDENDEPKVQVRCMQISMLVRRYSKECCERLPPLPEIKSQMLLVVMEAWVAIDMMVCRSFPLLEEFHPTFRPDMLDVFVLPKRHDMERARLVQSYLRRRVTAAGLLGAQIFDDPGKGSFAERYYDQNEALQELHRQILAKEDAKRKFKEKEWKKKNSSYLDITSRIDRMNCEYVVDRLRRMQKHHPDCERCRLGCEAERLKIDVFEEFLPNDRPNVAKAVVFELDCPQLISLYRDFCWFILRTLAYYNLQSHAKVVDTVHTYSQLSIFSNVGKNSVTLGSRFKSCKSEVTHIFDLTANYD